MNFVNFKKVLVLGSALLAFSNVSNAGQDGIKYIVQNNNYYNNNVFDSNCKKLLGDIKEGIIEDINNSGKKDDILKQISSSSTQLVISDNKIGNIIDDIINSKKILKDSTSSDIDNSDTLLSTLKLISKIESIKTNLNIQNNVNQGGSHAQYDFFKGITLKISNNNMGKLQAKIENDCKGNNSQNFFIHTISEILKYSTYKMNKSSLDMLNNIFNGYDKFTISVNNKLYHNMRKNEFEDGSINRSQNLDSLMDLINTNFIMRNSEYNTLSNFASLIKQSDLNNITSKGNLLPENVESASELSKIITSIVSGEIFKNQPDGNDGIQFSPEEMKEFGKKMQSITVNDIKDLCQKEKNNQLNDSEKREFKYYKDIYLKELENKKKNNTPLDQREQAILAYEAKNKNPIPDGNGDDNVNKYTKDSIPGITDKLFEKGFCIESIEAAPDAPQGAKVLSLDDINGFLNNIQAGTIVFDGRLNKYKGLHIGYDRISRTAIGQKMKKKIDDNLMHEISKLENNFIIFEIKQLPGNN